jgi:HEAT repeat protein
MRKTRTFILVLSVSTGLLFCHALAAQPGRNATPSRSATGMESISRYILLLKSGSAQEKAAAAYKLGQQRSAAAEVVNSLAELLGDTTSVDPSQYRRTIREHRPTLGEEAAVALVHIGHPSIEPLIRILKTSPSTEARKNAAWALGAIHETGGTEVPAV